jgi:hypothetical protein
LDNPSQAVKSPCYECGLFKEDKTECFATCAELEIYRAYLDGRKPIHPAERARQEQAELEEIMAGVSNYVKSAVKTRKKGPTKAKIFWTKAMIRIAQEKRQHGWSYERTAAFLSQVTGKKLGRKALSKMLRGLG